LLVLADDFKVNNRIGHGRDLLVNA
jgi:hypothetical protein